MDDDSPFSQPAPPLQAVESMIDRLRPALVADGGNVEVLGIEPDGTVRIVFQGTCASCPAQTATLRYGLEAPLREALPGITAVVAF